MVAQEHEHEKEHEKNVFAPPATSECKNFKWILLQLAGFEYPHHLTSIHSIWEYHLCSHHLPKYVGQKGKTNQ